MGLSLGGLVQDVIDSAEKVVEGAGDAVGDVVGGVGDAVGGIGKGLKRSYEAIESTAEEPFKAVGDIGRGIKHFARGEFNEAWDSLYHDAFQGHIESSLAHSSTIGLAAIGAEGLKEKVYNFVDEYGIEVAAAVITAGSSTGVAALSSAGSYASSLLTAKNLISVASLYTGYRAYKAQKSALTGEEQARIGGIEDELYATRDQLTRDLEDVKTQQAFTEAQNVEDLSATNIFSGGQSVQEGSGFDTILARNRAEAAKYSKYLAEDASRTIAGLGRQIGDTRNIYSDKREAAKRNQQSDFVRTVYQTTQDNRG